MQILMKAAWAGSMMAAMLVGAHAAQAETVMQQCGQQYQAAKAANTLNGMNWTQFRTDCAAKLKAQPVSATAPAAVPATQTANPLNPTPAATTVPAPTPAATTVAGPSTTATGGRAAFVARERQCGSEWRANKTTLIAATPGLTWPKYLSQCNTRIKTTGK